MMRRLPHSGLVFSVVLTSSFMLRAPDAQAAPIATPQKPFSLLHLAASSSSGGSVSDETGGEIGGDNTPDVNQPDGKQPVVKETGPTGECDRLTAPKESKDPKTAKEPVDWDHAVIVCYAALEAHPDDPHFHLALATADFHTKHYIEAVRHYKIAADANIPAAQSSLGFAYHAGLGTVKDDEKAFQLWMKAAEAGWPAAMGNLGAAYSDGIYVKKDPVKALDWSEKAIEAGNILSLSVVGNAYLNGNGVDRDFVMAAQYFQQGADLGEGFALKALANMYEVGFMGAPQPDKAGALRLLAQQLDPDSPNPSPPSVFKSILQASKARPQVHHTTRRYVIYRRYRFFGCGYVWC